MPTPIDSACVGSGVISWYEGLRAAREEAPLPPSGGLVGLGTGGVVIGGRGSVTKIARFWV